MALPLHRIPSSPVIRFASPLHKYPGNFISFVQVPKPRQTTCTILLYRLKLRCPCSLDISGVLGSSTRRPRKSCSTLRGQRCLIRPLVLLAKLSNWLKHEKGAYGINHVFHFSTNRKATQRRLAWSILGAETLAANQRSRGRGREDAPGRV
ncbi:hypothetical protein L228DRAFT_181142 [Xylona heveae TC161]|uniref:Uncharacterized protein n=1 Tax=Xylona heveae (strain CBS 132557 / TC161) TaxID=1328760 RepID=A0A165FE58_XYLHT|nr:hypothetical protein L228DRAFT_181142 [Xylona heveae TC161]KZF20874.1 hypothetical protein L228DRAFT_181142 [Xylona heveae TC161]